MQGKESKKLKNNLTYFKNNYQVLEVIFCLDNSSEPLHQWEVFETFI